MNSHLNPFVCLTTGDDKCPKCHRVRSVNVHLAGDPDNYKLSELLPNPALLDASADNATRDYFTFRHRTYISMSYVVRGLRIYSNNSFQVSDLKNIRFSCLLYTSPSPRDS